MKSEPGPPMTLGGAAAARVRFIVWCLECRYQVEPATASLRAAEGRTTADPTEMARRYGPERRNRRSRKSLRQYAAGPSLHWLCSCHQRLLFPPQMPQWWPLDPGNCRGTATAEEREKKRPARPCWSSKLFLDSSRLGAALLSGRINS
jgi:hypothetical protein